jgi:hypothetical protein
VDPTKFLISREANLHSKDILKSDYDEYLRASSDTIWIFETYYEYKYGGKRRFDKYWLLFYSRNFIPDNVNLQISEIILATFSLDGNIISQIPVAGGYGDSIAFFSTINSIEDISVTYKTYSSDGVKDLNINHFVDEMGFIKKK